MNAIKRLLLASVVLLVPAMSAADVVVSHFEPLQSTKISAADKTALVQGPQFKASASTSIQFDALGRTFDLLLETNDRVTSGLSADSVGSGIGVYRGKLADNPDSWARIVVFDGMPSGIIWDGAEMFAVEAPGDSVLAIDSPIIYRLADAYITPGTMSCGVDSLSGNAAAVVKELNTSFKTAVARAPGAISEILMSVIGDYEFTSLKGGDVQAEAALTARFNNIDGYFSEQVGVQLNVQLFETHSDPMDPFADTLVASDYLDFLSLYREQTAAHNTYGLTHLYTGRDLVSPTVGIAWRGLLCDDYFSAGLSEGRDSATIDSLIAAHEIGHNFGAEHDGQAGSVCETVVGQFIMSPSVSGVETFSDCSIGVMQDEAAGAQCVAPLAAIDVSVRPIGQVPNLLLGANTDLVYEVSSNGTLDVSGVVANFVLPSTLSLGTVTTTMGTCTSGAGTVDCDLETLPGLSSATVTISTIPTTVGVGMLTAAVSTTDVDERPSNNQDAIQLTVDPAVDLVVDVPTAAAVFVDTVTTVTANLDNVSVLDASDIVLSIVIEPGLEPSSATWSIGSCTVAAQQIDCQASNFPANTSSTLSITATAVTTGRKDVTVTLSSTEAEANPGDNTFVGEVRVVTPNNEKDEGGGAADPLLLLLLCSALAIRRRQYLY